jgi:hypothetical protein
MRRVWRHCCVSGNVATREVLYAVVSRRVVATRFWWSYPPSRNDVDEWTMIIRPASPQFAFAAPTGP